MNIQHAIQQLIDGHSLQRDEMVAVMRQIMSGDATDAQIAGLLVALRIKGETVDEIAAAAIVMRELLTPVSIDCDYQVDIVGTGGDGAKLFNVSTASSFVAAAAGCHVAKHGNRSVSSSSGSADLLEAAGVNLSLTPAQVARCIEQVGVGFMFALNHHSAMKHAIGPRKELATRTIFNVLGPLTNPAGVKNQLLGVYSADLVRPIADVLHSLGSERVMVVHARDGLDEISLAGETLVAELKDGAISEYVISPEQVGIDAQSLDALRVENAEQSLLLVKQALSGVGAAADMVALNAGAAIYVAGAAASWQQGVSMAQDVMSGQSVEKLQELVVFSRALSA